MTTKTNTLLNLVIQHPRDLVLAIATDAPLPQTQTLLQANSHYGGWCVDWHIIGESHRVAIHKNDSFIMEEMLACITLPAQTKCYQHTLTDLTSHRHKKDSYAITVEVADSLPAWANYNTNNQLRYAFPQVDGITPETVIQWEHQDATLRWQTLHTYIVEGALIAITTRSQIILN